MLDKLAYAGGLFSILTFNHFLIDWVFHKTADIVACAFEFDINTSGEFSRELPKSRLPSLMQELASFAFEIAKKGDVR